MRGSLIGAAVILCSLSTGPALALDSQDSALLVAEQVQASMAGGLSRVDRRNDFGAMFAFRAGLPAGLEIAFPLALGFHLVDLGAGSTIYAGLGIVDLYLSNDLDLYLSPAAVLAVQARLGAEAMFRAQADLTGIERGAFQGEHPAWVRGAAALAIDFGPWLTLACGVAYQHIVAGDGVPKSALRAGWAGDVRVSVGAVRSQPFGDLPVVSLHVTRILDVIGIIRVDIDMESKTTDSRWLAGVEVSLI